MAELAKLPRSKDGKIRAPPSAGCMWLGKLGYRVSRKFACWRFSRNALQIKIPSASKYSDAAFSAFLNRFDPSPDEGLRRRSAHVHHG